jgi:hypothetical protein
MIMFMDGDKLERPINTYALCIHLYLYIDSNHIYSAKIAYSKIHYVLMVHCRPVLFLF